MSGSFLYTSVVSHSLHWLVPWTHATTSPFNIYKESALEGHTYFNLLRKLLPKYFFCEDFILRKNEREKNVYIK